MTDLPPLPFDWLADQLSLLGIDWARLKYLVLWFGQAAVVAFVALWLILVIFAGRRRG